MQRSFETVARTSGNYTLTAADEYLGVGTREAPLTITLPSRLAVRPGYSFFIKDESAQASAFPITIQAVGGEEIEGASSYVMNVDGGFIEITNNSARFLVLGSHVSSVLGIDAGGTDADTAEEAVDNLGLDVKAPVRVAAKTNIDITAFPLSVNSETLIAGDSVTGLVESTTVLLANTSVLDQCVFIANRAYQVTAISEVHAVAGTDVGDVSLQVTKDTGTDAPGAGTDLLTDNTGAGFNMKGTANTVQSGTLVTPAIAVLAAGDRLSLDFAGTVADVAGVVVTITLKAI